MSDYDRTRKLFAETENYLRTSRERADRSRMERWQKRAGSALPGMLGSRAAAIAALADPVAEIRNVAIDVLQYHWRSESDRDFAELCEMMAIGDTDRSVRANAFLQLGNCYEGTDDVRIGALMARIVQDDAEQPSVRTAAYQSLLTLRALLLKKHPMGVLTPNDIDWPYVDSFLDETRTPSPVDPLAVSLPKFSKAQIQALRLYRQGTLAFEQGEYQRSIDYFTEALDNLPTARGAVGNRGLAYMALGAFGDAIADFTRAIQLWPDAANGYIERARAYRASGQAGLAEADERRAAQIAKEEQGENG
jgi:tetratricopeptide (TPR) repeat protein